MPRSLGCKQVGSRGGTTFSPINSKHWWKVDEPHAEIFSVLGRLQSATDERDARWRRYLCLLLNKNVTGWTPGQLPKEQWQDLFARGSGGSLPGLALNPMGNCASTLAARIATQKIRPLFVTSTSGSNAYELRKLARLLQKAVDGEFYRGRVYEKGAGVFLDAAAVGMGVMAVYSENRRLCYERIWPGELILDEQACLTTPNRTLYQVRFLPTETLAERYPDAEEEIEAQAGQWGLGTTSAGYVQVTDLVQVVEAWHLGARADRSDGRHATAINGVTLAAEEWRRETFPFAWYPWSKPILGFWPAGLVEQEETLQWFLNKILGRIEGAIHLNGVMRTYAPRGSVKPTDLRNVNGDVVFYEGAIPPTDRMPASLSSEVMRLPDVIKQWVFEDAGVSQLSASSVKPPGIESGVALRYLAETETGRHAEKGQAWERFWCQLAELTIEEARSIGGLISRHIDGEGYEEIRWSEIDLDRDAYELQVFPTSYLPATPAGRIQAVQEMLQAGFIPAKIALQMLQMPDIEQFTSLETASIEDIDRQIEAMIEGEEQKPQPYQDLALGLARVTSALLRARADGVPEASQKRLVDWLVAADRLVNPEPAAPPMPPGPTGPSPATGGSPVGPSMPPMPAPIPGPQAPTRGLELATPAQPLR